MNMDLPTRAYATQAFARAWQMQVANIYLNS